MIVFLFNVTLWSIKKRPPWLCLQKSLRRQMNRWLLLRVYFSVQKHTTSSEKDVIALKVGGTISNIQYPIQENWLMKGTYD